MCQDNLQAFLNKNKDYSFYVVIFAPGSRRGPEFDTADPWVRDTTEDSLRKFHEMAAYGALLYLGPRMLQDDLTSLHQHLVSTQPEAALKSATANVEWLTGNVYRKDRWCPDTKCTTHGDASDFTRKLGTFLVGNPFVAVLWNRIAKFVFEDYNDRIRLITSITRVPTSQTFWDETAQYLYDEGRRQATTPGNKRQRHS